jgi:hypothetical protein
MSGEVVERFGAACPFGTRGDQMDYKRNDVPGGLLANRHRDKVIARGSEWPRDAAVDSVSRWTH